MKRKCAEMSWKLLVAQKSEPVLWRTLHQAFHLLILFFYSETSLVFKFNQVTCLPFYLLILCVSWSSVSASKLFLYELVKFLWSQWLSGGGGRCVGCGRTSLRILSVFFGMLNALFYSLFHLIIFRKIFHSNTSSLQPVNLILVNFAYFFTFSFFSETPMNGWFRNFNGC